MRTVQRAALGVAILSAVTLGVGCHRGKGQAPEPVLTPITLYVRNSGFFDVNIYSLTSAGISSRVRLGMVGGNSKSQIIVRPAALRSDGGLVLYLHTIGSSYYWTTPMVLVHSDLVACLDILTNPDGNLNRSTLYTLPKSRAADIVDATAASATSGGVNSSVNAGECGS
ncbi:MAG: hypothetical protein IT359_18450 [Gemmatimonadaceae bacterium]|nr:hypothetical protein [Gemmatimonadaceae bacterium]